MGIQYTLIGNEDGTSNLVAFVPGGSPQVAHSSHPNFEAILAGVLDGDESVVDLFDVAKTVASRFEGLSERVSVAHGRLYLDGDEVDNALSRQVIRFMEEGVDPSEWMSLVYFFENVQANPNEHSREQLYSWLSQRDFTITDDGMIVGYKGVSSDGNGSWLSVHSGKAMVDGVVHTGRIPNPIGAVIEMPRSEVHHDPSTGCSTGLHVARYEYAMGYSGGGTLLEVHVNPRDVVSVPTDSDYQKVRCCRYEVIGEVEAPYSQAVISSGRITSYPESSRDDYDWGDDWSDPDDDPDDETDFDPTPLTTVRRGDRFQDTDPRRTGRTLTVESIEYPYAKTTSSTGVKRDILLDRLTSRKYRKV
jgi:hypothetical protein